MSSGNFFIRFFSAIWRGINGLRKVLHLVLLLFIFMLVFGVMSGEAPPILPHKAALVVQPVGALVEQMTGDPYERATITSNSYFDWMLDRAYLLVPAQAFVGNFLATFKEYPPRMKAASFSLDQVMEKLQQPGGAR